MAANSVSGAGISVVVDIPNMEAIQRALGQYDQVATREITSAMYRATNTAQETMSEMLESDATRNAATMRAGLGSSVQPLAPVNSTAVAGSRLISAIVQPDAGSVVGRVGGKPARQVYWQMIEEGRPAGKGAPIIALARWAQQVLGVSGTKKEVRLVGRNLAAAIKQHGIKPTPVRERTLNQVQSKVFDIFGAAAERILATLAQMVK